LHDNARPHTARLTLETVEQLGLEVLPHLPYSPDLAASDYHLFGLMKKMLAGQKFASDTEVQSVVSQWLVQQPASFFASGIQKLVDRCRDRPKFVTIRQPTETDRNSSE